MNKIYNFEKQGIKFSFRNPLWNDFYKQLKMEWKIVGVKENKENDGYFYNSSFIPTKNAMELNGIKINGKEVAGVKLPENILSEIKALYEQYKEKDLQKNLTKDIQYTMNDATAYGIYNGISEFDITEIVSDIKKQLNCISFFPCCKNIAKVLTKDRELKDIANNTYQPNPEGNWNNEYLIWFRQAAQEKKAPGFGLIPNQIIRLKIAKIITSAIQEENKKDQEENDRINNLFELAKQTGKMQVIDKWMENCNDPKEECNTDLVTVYAMPNGVKKVVKNHTW